MSQNDIDQLVSNLSVTLKTLENKAKEGSDLKLTSKNISQIIRQIPYGGVSGDQISGGKIQNFSSTGIADSATNTMLFVTNDGIRARNADFENLKGNVTVENTLVAENVTVTNDLTVSGTLRANIDIDYNALISKIPNRSITGDKINGGTIRNFSSAGIKDSSNSNTKLVVTDTGVVVDDIEIKTIKGSVNFTDGLKTPKVEAETIEANKIHVKELFADIRIERTAPLEFKQSAGNPVIGKGLLWTGSGITKQFILREGDQLFSTENMNVNKGRSYQIDNIPVLSFDTLGTTVTKSRLKEVGNLKSLTVLGDVNFDNVITYNSTSQRLGFGIEEPNSKFSIADEGVELKLGIESGKAILGTHGYNDVVLTTDNTARVTISAGGRITLGDKNNPPTQIHVHGKVSIGVNTPDPNVDLHVNGSVKFNNKLQAHGVEFPKTGSYSKGDIVWNTEPRTGQPIGWVCIIAGTPGEWRPFGIIG